MFSNFFKKYFEVILFLIILTGFYMLSLYSFVIFHSIVEIFVSVICLTVFVITWHSRNFIKNNFFIIVGISFLFVGIFNLAHAGTFPGLSLSVSANPSLFSDFRIIGSLIQAATFLIALFFVKRRSNNSLTLAILFVLGVFLMGGLLAYPQYFPHTAIQSGGLNYFGDVMEILISLIFLAGFIFFHRRRGEFNPTLYTLMSAALFFMIFSEMPLIFVQSTYDIFATVSVLFRGIAFYLIYRAFIVVALNDPYDFLFKELSNTDSRLKNANDSLLAANNLLMQEKSKINTIIQSVGDGLVAIDRSWNVILWSAAAAEITGWTEAEVLGKSARNCLRFLKEHDRTENVMFIEEAMLYGRTRQMSERTILIKKDGSEVPVGDSAAPIFDAAKNVIGAVIVFRDTTAERNMEMISSDFAYASHQLRTPATEALLTLENAQSKRSLEKVRAEIAIAQQSLASIKKLSNSLIDLIEIDKKNFIIKSEIIDIRKTVAEVLKGVENTAKARNIKIDAGFVIIKNEKIITDERILRKILVEVLDNAVNYSLKNSRVSLEISTDGDLNIKVQDRGIGVDEKEIPLIFTRFFRGGNVPKRVPGGGLGLYIAKSYVEALGGRIWLESKINKGTTFFVQLPIREI